LGLWAEELYWALVRSPSLFRICMYAYAACGGTHTYKYIAQSTGALERKIFFQLLLCNLDWRNFLFLSD
jgi:hypothetical protein